VGEQFRQASIDAAKDSFFSKRAKPLGMKSRTTVRVSALEKKLDKDQTGKKIMATLLGKFKRIPQVVANIDKILNKSFIQSSRWLEGVRMLRKMLARQQVHPMQGGCGVFLNTRDMNKRRKGIICPLETHCNQAGCEIGSRQVWIRSV